MENMRTGLLQSAGSLGRFGEVREHYNKGRRKWSTTGRGVPKVVKCYTPSPISNNTVSFNAKNFIKLYGVRLENGRETGDISSGKSTLVSWIDVEMCD